MLPDTKFPTITPTQVLKLKPDTIFTFGHFFTPMRRTERGYRSLGAYALSHEEQLIQWAKEHGIKVIEEE
jgi:hypothetical protein